MTIQSRNFNPFNVTKAVDFDDEQIHDLWVDLPSGRSFVEIIKPTSPMPMFILGGKGSGKTHVMRYLAYELQKIRHKSDILAGLRRDGYVGVYFRCSGLNADRFKGKALDVDTWRIVFAYFMELWFAELILKLTIDLHSICPIQSEAESQFCKEVYELFDHADFQRPETLADFSASLRDLQKTLNLQINNLPFTGNPELKILASPGTLTFGVPKLIEKHFVDLQNIRILYLIDEFENLNEAQQCYVNTLYREKELPCSFKIGSRLYGIRTYKTYSGEEENKEGSEFESLYLDDQLRNVDGYASFAETLCLRRLRVAGISANSMSGFFAELSDSERAKDIVDYATKFHKDGEEFPHLVNLRKKLNAAVMRNEVHGVNDIDQVESVITKLQNSDPFLEKLNTFLLYQDWARKEDVLESAEQIALECRNFASQSGEHSRYSHVINHFKNDLLAQMCREMDRKVPYQGFKTFVDISDGLPRHLLMILKHVYQWSYFNGEMPFEGKRQISVDSQNLGVRDAANWFYEDARKTGSIGDVVRRGLDQLGTVLKEVRYSDKPSECSATAFSADLAGCSDQTKYYIELCVKWSLLIRHKQGQKEKNTKRIIDKYQLNSMLSPRWDLSVGYRGALNFRSDELDELFEKDFGKKVRSRIAKMYAPFGIRTNSGSTPLLPGLE